jgi:hypothetical protein
MNTSLTYEGKRIQSDQQTATQTDTILVMTKNFDVISELPLHTNETGERKSSAQKSVTRHLKTDIDTCVAVHRNLCECWMG